MKEYGRMAVQLMKELVKFDTSNGPGNEGPLAEYIADILKKEGFAVEVQRVAENAGEHGCLFWAIRTAI